jgi:hypothetical protein
MISIIKSTPSKESREDIRCPSEVVSPEFPRASAIVPANLHVIVLVLGQFALSDLFPGEDGFVAPPTLRAVFGLS